MAGKHNFTAYKGTTLSNSVTYQDSEGTAIDLTGFTATMEILEEWEGTVALTLSIGSGLTVTTPTNGIIDIEITDEQTDVLSVKVYKYILNIESAGGKITRLIDGSITVNH